MPPPLLPPGTAPAYEHLSLSSVNKIQKLGPRICVGAERLRMFHLQEAIPLCMRRSKPKFIFYTLFVLCISLLNDLFTWTFISAELYTVYSFLLSRLLKVQTFPSRRRRDHYLLIEQ